MKFNILIHFLSFSLALVLSQKVRYDGYRLIRIIPSKSEHLSLLDEWEKQPDFDMWTHIRGLNDGVDVALSPIAFEKYGTLMNQKMIKFEVLDENLQNRIDEEEKQMKRNRLLNANKIAGTYARHDTINAWLDTLVAANPSYLRTAIIGSTLENRVLKTITLKKGNPQRKIWIDCGIHAREWLSPSTCTYIIDKLITLNNNHDPTVTSLLNKYEIYFLPVLNPDGYEYSHNTTRLWRKNRAFNQFSTCRGVDINRNFGFQFQMSGSGLWDPCSDVYAGSFAESEPETRALQSVINSAPGQWDAFITIHSYGQWFLTPWGYTTAKSPDYTEQFNAGQRAATAMQSVHNMKYTVGSAGALLYIAAGSSIDWSYATAKIKYSYTIELRPENMSVDAGIYGFVYPEDKAPLVAEETYQGIINLLTNI